MDISRFRAAFFDESREGLEVMESGLLGMEHGIDADTMNSVFRAAHSIKGGAATFGFTAVTNLTHLLETLLDEARAGKRTLDPAAITILLESVDVLRELLMAVENGSPVDTIAEARISSQLNQLLASGIDQPVVPATPASTAAARWRIDFKPFPSFFLSGNDPLRILRELGTIGELDIQLADVSPPAFTMLDPHQSWLAWHLQLNGEDIDETAIRDVFAWVDDQCELDISAVHDTPLPISTPEMTALTATDSGAGREGRRATDNPGDSSIRVSVTKVDTLINLVGELVITQAMLLQQSRELDPGQHEAMLSGLAQLDRNTRELQEAVMGVRMLPVDFAFSRFPRMVRDLAARLDKKVRLRTQGEATELDKSMIEKIVDPLVHLVRNAIDHGLESSAERAVLGKDETGTINMSAQHQGGHIVIEVSDDGRGLDRNRILSKASERGLLIPENPSDAQVWDLIFHPGFSTAEALTDLSGRGVGMDVVKSNITSLGGKVEIRSQAGIGTTVSIRLPLTLAILDGMSVAAGDNVFILPLSSVVESLQPGAGQIHTVANQTRVLKVRDDYLPLLSLAGHYRLANDLTDKGEKSITVVVESHGSRVALQVDELLGQHQVVVKNLENNYRRVPGVSGATILGDGRVALIVDVDAFTREMTILKAA